jgi:hypothetical protein
MSTKLAISSNVYVPHYVEMWRGIPCNIFFSSFHNEKKCYLFLSVGLSLKIYEMLKVRFILDTKLMMGYINNLFMDVSFLGGIEFIPISRDRILSRSSIFQTSPLKFDSNSTDKYSNVFTKPATVLYPKPVESIQHLDTLQMITGINV